MAGCTWVSAVPYGEVNPRASRTSPFVSKATGMPLAKVAAKVMVGVSLATPRPSAAALQRYGFRAEMNSTTSRTV